MTANVLAKETQYTVEEYFKIEELSNHKSEFRNGKIIAMAGGSYEHGKISLNIAIALAMLLNDTDFDVISSDQAIFIPEHNRYVYSDAAVIKGEPQFPVNNKRAVVNPTLIFEVTSSSTEKYDRFEKFNLYKSIATFEEYVLVDQEMPLVEVFYKREENVWQRKTYIGLQDTVELTSLGVELKMADIYKKVNNLLNLPTAMDF
jgi:Uma2 family endonuclease